MKLLLTSAATALVMGTTAYAESHTMGMGAFEVTADDFYASNLMGMRIYASEQELGTNGDMINFADQEWDDIGEINDLVISEDGSVQAVIVGVGGFLGIGEKDVAITMDQIRTYDDENGERFLVVNSTQEALEAAPGFERASDEGVAMSDGEAAEPGMVEQTGAAATAAATATMADGEAEVEAEAGAEPGSLTAEVSDEASDLAEDTQQLVDGEPSDEAMDEQEEAAEELAEGEAEAADEMAEGDTEDAAEAMAEGQEEAAEEMQDANEEMAEGDAAMTDTATAPAAGATTAGMVEREGYTTTAITDLSTDEITGATVYGANDENIGEIEDLVASDSGEITQAVIGVGGFLGIGEKKVAVNFEDLQILSNEEGSDIRVYISATEDELKALPKYEAPAEAMETDANVEMETETAPAAQ
ncbi:PRC-barrel domain-containing protein [uncultured Limimaricola sp.]|uniref:PRC-barrel domain-containing protein n=1 Tax=uncultured Limimaricola sp. TaxID=2211667 RepID=UPI0030F5E2A0